MLFPFLKSISDEYILLSLSKSLCHIFSGLLVTDTELDARITDLEEGGGGSGSNGENNIFRTHNSLLVDVSLSGRCHVFSIESLRTHLEVKHENTRPFEGISGLFAY